MKCDNCGKEDIWLDSIGSNYICHKCIQKHKIMGLVFRTHIDTFKKILKKLKPKNYQEYMQLQREQIEKAEDLKRRGIKLT